MANSISQPQSGFVLITGLVFVLIISVVTISTMQSSNMDYKISTNELFKDVAFQGSESAKTASGGAISYFIYHRRWDGFETNGLTYEDGYNPSTDIPEDGVEDLYTSTSLITDMTYDIFGENIETIEAGISILKSPGAKSRGSGLQQLSGYEGLGKGAGAGGIFLVYELRSTGQSAAQAVAVTASEFRIVP